MKNNNPADRQIGGDHYTKLAIQPMQYSMANSLNALQHTIIKYVTRYKDKGGVEDLRKAIHCIELLIQHEPERPFWGWPSEERIDAIGQNGPTAEHYQPELLAIPDDVVIPDWVECIGAYWGGDTFGYCTKPLKRGGRYVMADGTRSKRLWIGKSSGDDFRLYKRTDEGFERVLD